MIAIYKVRGEWSNPPFLTIGSADMVMNDDHLAEIAVLRAALADADHLCKWLLQSDISDSDRERVIRENGVNFALAIAQPATKPGVHSEHWRNPETGQVECECCFSWALDCEQDRKQIAVLRAAGGTALYEMGFASSKRAEFSRAVDALDAALRQPLPREEPK